MFRVCLLVLTDPCRPAQHPVLDEPIAEAVCIIADTDKWTVQVASSQRRATDVNKLGKEVLVSSLVSSLLQSTHQLYKLNLTPNFVRPPSSSSSVLVQRCDGLTVLPTLFLSPL